MTNITELVKEVVALHRERGEEVSPEDALHEVHDIMNAAFPVQAAEPKHRQPRGRKIDDPLASIGSDKVKCLVCNYEGMVITRHLKTAHHMTPDQYKTKFGIAPSVPLVARNYSQVRRDFALKSELGRHRVVVQQPQQPAGPRIKVAQEPAKAASAPQPSGHIVRKGQGKQQAKAA